ncbi:MAG: hypothetical protein U0P46_13465 [Holophagaceae bacterium]
MFQKQRVVNAFEKVQTLIVLLVGFGGALRVALATGSGAGVLGSGASLAGFGCYATALRFAEERDETRANFSFFTVLALLLVLLGGFIALPLGVFAPMSGALGLLVLGTGLRMRRTVLFLQGGAFLLAGLLASGLLSWSIRAFFAAGGVSASMSLPGALCLGFLAGALAWFLLRRPADALTRKVRPLILGLGALAAIGAGAQAVRSLGAALSPGAPQADLLATIRTGILSLLALALAWFGRRRPILELRWLVYPLLIVTALKFLFEDLAVGRPLTLFLGFTCFGATLMVAPRLLKGTAPSNASTPEVDS